MELEEIVGAPVILIWIRDRQSFVVEISSFIKLIWLFDETD